MDDPERSKGTAIAAEAEARNIIQKARMKGIDLAEYNVLFDTYGDDSDFGEMALLLFYKKGLPKALREKVAGTYPKPANFEEYKERAMDLHLEWLNDREESKTWASSTTDRSTNSKNTDGRKGLKVNAAETSETRNVEAFNTEGNRPIYPKKLTDEERERFRREGICFACRQKGHASWDCTKFPRNSSTPSSFTPRPGPSVRVANTTTNSSAATTTESSGTDAMKEVTDLMAKIRALKGEDREAAASLLKDITSNLDF
jgi:hypothetical protein